jgi:hypothetical protein
VFADLSANQKQVTERVLEKTGRTQNDMLSWPAVSVFNPDGEKDHPRPKLVDKNGKYRQTLFCGSDMGDLTDTMTREEILAFNAIDSDCEARGGTWTATLRKNGTTEVLTVKLPMGSDDDIRGFPPLTAILYELRRGKRMPDVNALIQRLHAQAPDPDVFVANLTRLLEQANQPVPVAA